MKKNEEQRRVQEVLSSQSLPVMRKVLDYQGYYAKGQIKCLLAPVLSPHAWSPRNGQLPLSPLPHASRVHMWLPGSPTNLKACSRRSPPRYRGKVVGRIWKGSSITNNSVYDSQRIIIFKAQIQYKMPRGTGSSKKATFCGMWWSRIC